MVNFCSDNRRCFVCVIIFAVLDISVSTLLFSHLTDFWTQVTNNVLNYVFETSTVEFWLEAIVRMSLLLGFTIGLRCSTGVDGLERIKQIKIPSVVFALLMLMLAIIKMLAYTERQPWPPPAVWFWCQFAWSLFASVAFLVCSVKLRNIKSSSTLDAEDESDNSSGEERQRLVSDFRLKVM